MQPKEGLSYSLCGFGQNLICTVIGSYLTVFMTDAIGFPAMEYNREGVFFGICAKMFVIAGPIIVFGVTASFLVGFIGYFVV